MKTYSNYAIDTCRAAWANPMDTEDYAALFVGRSALFDCVLINWLGYSFTCAYGRKTLRLETIGM